MSTHFCTASDIISKVKNISSIVRLVIIMLASWAYNMNFEISEIIGRSFMQIINIGRPNIKPNFIGNSDECLLFTVMYCYFL